MAKKLSDVHGTHSGKHIARQAGASRRHQADAYGAREDFVKDSPVNREARAVVDSGRGNPTGDATSPASQSDRRAFSPQRQSFSSASRDVDRAVTPDWPYNGRSKHNQPR
jgi:hypothetical protein